MGTNEFRRIPFDSDASNQKKPGYIRQLHDRRRIEIPHQNIGKEFFFPSYPRSWLNQVFTEMKNGCVTSTCSSSSSSGVVELELDHPPIKRSRTENHKVVPLNHFLVLAEYLGSYVFEFRTLGCSSIKKGDTIDIVSLLFPDHHHHHLQKKSELDDGHFLVRVNNGVVVSQVGLNDSCLGRKRYILVFCFVVPTFWCDDHDTWNIVKATSELKKKKSRHGDDDFEMVVVVKMREKWADDADAFYHFFSAFPDCIAVPFENKLARDHICDLLFCGGKPTSLIVDTVDGKVLQYGGACDFWDSYGADAFPFTDERLRTLEAQRLQLLRNVKQGATSLEELLPPSTVLSNSINEEKKICVSQLNDKIVGLYLCLTGSLMLPLIDVHRKCMAEGRQFEIVVVYAPFVCRDPTFLQDYIDKILKKAYRLCDWWVLRPFTDSISRRLWKVFGTNNYDKLIMVGPNGEYLEPYGGEVLQLRDFGGVDAFPFTRERVINREVKRLRAINLDQVLVAGPSQNYVLRGMNDDSDHVPVATLCNKFVLVCFCNLDAGDHHYHLDASISRKLYFWFRSLKENHPNDFEVVLFAVGCSLSKLSCRDCKRLMSEMPWLVCPFDHDHANTVVERIFRSRHVSWYEDGLGVLAFGEDGYLFSTNAHELMSNGSDAFSFSYDMRKEVLARFVDKEPFFRME